MSGATQSFQVQYQRASAAAPPQVRLFFSATKVTPWVTVTTRLELDPGRLARVARQPR